MKKQKTSDRGITLIALIITIIVLLILAGVSINAIVGENGILSNAQNATLASRLASYKEELELNLVDDYEDANNINCVGEKVKNYIPNMEDDEVDSFVIYKGKLMYIGDDTLIQKVATSLDIENGSENSKDIVQVTDVITKICNSVTPPANDTVATPTDCIGTRLYDKNNQNSTNWRLVIEYTNSNKLKQRYGSGWYLLKAGTTIGDGVKTKNDYVVNYGTNEIVLLSNYKEWTLSSQLAVTDGIVLNVDAKNLSDGEWTGVVKHGNVVYKEDKQALYFDGNKSYLEITKAGDFSDGFTFEFYGNLETLLAIASPTTSLNKFTGFFCRMASLNDNVTSSMRFGIAADNNQIGYRFGTKAVSQLFGENFYMRNDGWGRQISNEKYIKVDKDFYLTVVYRRNISTSDEEKNKLDWTDTHDRLFFYVDGILVGYCPYNVEVYEAGMLLWNNDTAPFWIGVCPFNTTAELYYYQGLVYSTRIYNKAISSEEVENNYNSTVQFRNSGL